jgi:protein-tyrosine phosphatase
VATPRHAISFETARVSDSGGVWPPGPGVVQLPDGRLVRGRGLREKIVVTPPDHGVYLLGSKPEGFDWSHRWVRWRDFWTPADTADALDALREAFVLAVDHRVELACAGGTGRTGCALAVMAIWAGVAPADAVAWVRRAYRRHAVETPWQRRWVERVTRSTPSSP